MTRRAISLMLVLSFAALPAADAQRSPSSRRAAWIARQNVMLVPAAPAAVRDTSSAAPEASEQPHAAAPYLRGVDIVTTGASSFTLRLHSTMLKDGSPLYVIDGAPAMDLPNGIDWFKPSDIMSVQVLKTPAELSSYGTRGVNGVVVITTKITKGR